MTKNEVIDLMDLLTVQATEFRNAALKNVADGDEDRATAEFARVRRVDALRGDVLGTWQLEDPLNVFDDEVMRSFQGITREQYAKNQQQAETK